jgi:flagellar protein FlaG
MEIRGASQSRQPSVEKTYKVPENIKVLKPVETSKPISEKEDNETEIKNAVGKINKIIEGGGSHLQYEKHDVLNQMIIKVIDDETSEVIREIPSRKVLDMVAKLCEMAGVLVDKKA